MKLNYSLGFALLSVFFLELGPINIHAGESKTNLSLASLVTWLQTEKFFPGELLPTKCVDGFAAKNSATGQVFATPVDPLSKYIYCAANDDGNQIRKFHINSSGHLIASVHVTLKNPRSGSCTQELLESFAGEGFKVAKPEASDHQGSLPEMNFDIASEISGLLKCEPDSNLSFTIRTPYSLLNDPEPTPYFKIARGRIEETKYVIDIKAKAFASRIQKFGPLAKKLFDDNMTWTKDDKVISERQRMFSTEIKNAQIEIDIFKSQFLSASPSFKKCSNEQTIAAITKKQMPPDNSKIIDLCLKSSPNSYREAGEIEVNDRARRIVDAEKFFKSQNGSYNTSVGGDAILTRAYLYKLGFVKPSAATASKLVGSKRPEEMNSDTSFGGLPGNFPFELSTLGIDFDYMKTYCPDCTASKDTFKALLFARYPGQTKIDAWTVDQTGTPKHILDGMPPIK